MIVCRRGHQWSGGHAGCDEQRLQHCAIPLLGDSAAGAWPLVICPHHPHGSVLLLQEPPVRPDPVLLQLPVLLQWADAVQW